jgi:hypothetical protein
MDYLGDHQPGQPVLLAWATNAKTGASIGRSVQGSLRVYKGGLTSEFTAGIVDTPNFDGVTGIQSGSLVTTDSFYTVGSDYIVLLVGSVIDGEQVNGIVGRFSILNRDHQTTGIFPGVVSGSIAPTVNRVIVDGITLPSNRLVHCEIRSGYGSSTPGMKRVIATHTLTSGRADLTFTAPADTNFVVGDRVLVYA